MTLTVRQAAFIGVGAMVGAGIFSHSDPPKTWSTLSLFGARECRWEAAVRAC